MSAICQGCGREIPGSKDIPSCPMCRNYPKLGLTVVAPDDEVLGSWVKRNDGWQYEENHDSKA